jgi:hypothetical protein
MTRAIVELYRHQVPEILHKGVRRGMVFGARLAGRAEAIIKAREAGFGQC